MAKIKPLRKKHRFIRWLKKLLGIKSPSEEWLRGAKDIDELHSEKVDGDDCTDCTYFVGCECFDGKTCDLFKKKGD